MDFPEGVCRLVLVGKTGSGKSSTGNSILGSPQFRVGHGFQSMTKTCWWMYGELFGVKVEVVDTPGIFDTEIDDATICKEIVKGIGCAGPGPHAVLFVIRADARFTEEEAHAVTYLRQLFGDGILHHIIVVFTHGDSFSSFQDFRCHFLQHVPSALGSFLQETGGRFVLFNNKEKDPGKNQEQARQLLLMVRRMLEHSGNKQFENPMLLRCHETMLADAESLLKKLGPQLSTSSYDLLRAALNGKTNAEQLLHVLMDRRDTSDTQLAHLTTKIKELEEALKQEDLTKEDLQKLLRQRDTANEELQTATRQQELAIQQLEESMRQKESTIRNLEQMQTDLLKQLKELQKNPNPATESVKKKSRCTVL